MKALQKWSDPSGGANSDPRATICTILVDDIINQIAKQYARVPQVIHNFERRLPKDHSGGVLLQLA